MLRIARPPTRWRWWGVRVATASALVIGGWCAFLAATLPRGGGLAWGLFWVALDAAETVAAAATAATLLRHSHLAAVTAGVGAALLLLDAGLDIATAHHGLDLARAVVQAAVGELPLGAAAIWLAVRVRRSRSRRQRATPTSSSPKAVRQ